MYFIVYIQSIKRHRVVPTNWMRRIESYTEKFMNYGVNSNQTFLVYWTNDLNAFDIDGIPDSNVIPNEAANIRDDFPQEGWYKCRIVKFKVEREQALRYVELRRNYAPALYNQRRLLEKPIPFVTQNVRANVQHNDHTTSHACTSDQSQNLSILASAVSKNVSAENVSPNVNMVTDEAGPSNQLSVEFVDVEASPDAFSNDFFSEDIPILIELTNRKEPSNDIHAELNSETNSDSVDKTAADACADVHTEIGSMQYCIYNLSTDETQLLDLEAEEKPDVMLVHDFSGENHHEISNILTGQTANEPTPDATTEPATQAVREAIQFDEDCEMSYSGTFPQPYKANVDKLIKRTDDDISMDKPFSEMKSGRIYKIGDTFVEISHRVIDRLRQWNEDRANNNVDRLYVLALLLVLVSKEDICRSNMDQNVVTFIRDLMWFRTSDEKRVAATEKYIQDYCREKAAEQVGENSQTSSQQ